MNSVLLNLTSYIPAVPQCVTTSFSKITALSTRTLAALGPCLIPASFCLYNLYRSYQFKWHPSFALDDKLKIVKCKTFLSQLKELDSKSPEAASLLAQCRALEASIKPNNILANKSDLLVELANYCAKTDPEQSYQIAKKLSFSVNLYECAHSIHANFPDFAPEKVADLLKMAMDDYTKRNKDSSRPFKPSILDVNWYLKFARAFDRVPNSGLMQESLNHAINLIKSFENPLTQLQGLCKIAKCCHDIIEPREAFFRLAKAEDLLNKIPEENLITSHLTLVTTYLSLGENEKAELMLNGELLQGIVRETGEMNQIPKYFYSLAMLAKQISEDKNAPRKVTDFANEISSRLDRTLQFAPKILAEETSEDRADTYLIMANAYKELGDKDKCKKAADLAFKEIQDCREEEEGEEEKSFFKSKNMLLWRLIRGYKDFPDDRQKALAEYETLYTQYKPKKSSLSHERDQMGSFIIECYNEMGLTETSNEFFKIYLQNIFQKDNRAFDKINDLVNQQWDGFTVEQRKAVLVEAEKLLSQVTPIQIEQTTEMVAEAYLKVDRQKSLELIEKYQNMRGNQHLVNASIVGIASAVLHFYPQAIPYILVGLGALTIYKTFSYA